MVENISQSKINSPFIMVIFGATGDLTQRKLIPALYRLYTQDLLPQHFYIVGFSRRTYTTADFQAFLQQAVKTYGKNYDDAFWQSFSGKCYYLQGSFDAENRYNNLVSMLSEFDTMLKSCVPRFFYLATPPDEYSQILKLLQKTKLSEGCGQGSDKWTKILIEKPFGRSLVDAVSLDEQLAQTFHERQIYRIDHYLGKETVQNILAFRFANSIFTPAWNKKYIDHIQITVAEKLGVETRGNFYEGVGALRDMAQSHLLELLAAVTMNQPTTFDAEGIRKSRFEILKSIGWADPENIASCAVRGQYGEGVLAGGTTVAAYRTEPKVDPQSMTETYVALKLISTASNWEGVPFYVRTGKRLAKQQTTISIVFKEPLLKMYGKNEVSVSANVLTFNISPNEGISLTLNAKKVGLENVFEPVSMDFRYPKETEFREAYERILMDGLRGDQTLFTRTDEVQTSWELVSKIKHIWEGEKAHFPNYIARSWGPKEADDLIKKDGKEWII